MQAGFNQHENIRLRFDETTKGGSKGTHICHDQSLDVEAGIKMGELLRLVAWDVAIFPPRAKHGPAPSVGY